jgi:hypothetical protein
MAKDKKAQEQRRQAKVMRQRARVKERQRQGAGRQPPDDFQMFRDDLLPEDLDPSHWSRAQIRHDLNELSPTEAMGRFMELFADRQEAREDEEYGFQAMALGMMIWKTALRDPEERPGKIAQTAAEFTSDPDAQEAFRGLAADLIRSHEELFPRLHARVARIRGKPRTDLPTESVLVPVAPGEAEALWAGWYEAEEGEAPTYFFMEFTRPILEVGGSDRRNLHHLFQTALSVWHAARRPPEEREAVLAARRDELETDADREHFDRATPVMFDIYQRMIDAGWTDETRPEEVLPGEKE